MVVLWGPSPMIPLQRCSILNLFFGNIIADNNSSSRFWIFFVVSILSKLIHTPLRGDDGIVHSIFSSNKFQCNGVLNLMQIQMFLFFLFFLISKPTSEEILLPIKINGKTGYVNLQGEVVIKPRFNFGGKFVHGLAPARIDGLFGYIDRTGKYVIPPIYDYAEDFSDGYGIIYDSHGVQHYIDRNGRIPFKATLSHWLIFTMA